jgi:hypothetical protein
MSAWLEGYLTGVAVLTIVRLIFDALEIYSMRRP